MDLKKERTRCGWAFAGNDLLYLQYHDQEWGSPLHDEHRLFELLVLEGAQAGLSWYTILRKRENYRKAFDYFDPAKVAKYNEQKIQQLLSNSGIVRNNLKIRAAVQNAKNVLLIEKEFASFDQFIWQFVGGKPIKNHRRTLAEIPATTVESSAMSKELGRRGFKFVGSTICYSFMQATGMVNDHIVDCFRYKQV